MQFHWDVHFDPFLFMQENNKIYGPFLLQFPPFRALCSWIILGFTISLYEFSRTIETLWSTVGGTLIQPSSSNPLFLTALGLQNS